MYFYCPCDGNVNVLGRKSLYENTIGKEKKKFEWIYLKLNLDSDSFHNVLQQQQQQQYIKTTK
ncbi:hypothetical protein DERF_002066 [Dermatophagoides farinae]|uniref:Uncharacterized protein n=1 Tax=Dermatophagoides farinae TaxID=6954 RepID=A0A922IBP8_DERFA|nr:hypothetical protein DERF_002066 [Dermatophagoides farinae]